jgi:hypothetical protein
MKYKYVIILFVLFWSALLHSQGIYNNGAKIMVKEGASVFIAGSSGHYTNENSGATDGEITLDGEMTINGSFYNNGMGQVFTGLDTIGLVVMGNENALSHELAGTGITSFENLLCPASNTIIIPAGVEIHVKYNFTLNGILELYGDIYIEGCFIYNGLITGTGAVHYESSSPQTVAGGYYPNLILNNPGGLVPEDSVFVEMQLVLELGSLILGDHNLVLGSDAIIVENKAPATWIDATGAGKVIKMFDKTGTFIFPVGNFGETPVYSPVAVDLKEAAFDNGQISVRLKPEVHPDNNTGSDFPNYLNRYWEVESEGLLNVLCDISFWYAETDVTGNEDSIDGGKYKDDEVTNWLHYGRVDASDHHFEAYDLNSFSIFSGVQGFRPPACTLVSPADMATVYDYELSVSGTAYDPDGDLEEILIKLNDGNWQTATGTDTWSKTLMLLPEINTILVKAKDNQGFESEILSISILMGAHEFEIPQGWSYISSFLEPFNPDIVNLMSELVDAGSLAILIGSQGIYAPPPFNINTIGEWDVLKGYKVKMNVADQFVMRGDELDNNDIELPAGINLMPVLTNVPVLLDEIFDDPLNDILYIFNIYTNQIYWPDGGIYTLTWLMPGQGYLTNLINPVSLTFPPMSKFGFDSPGFLPPDPGPWRCNRTADFHLISITRNAIAGLINTSYIGAFNSEGHCIGYASIENQTKENILLTVYGNDELTTEKDGALQGEPISLKSINLQNNKETVLTAIYNNDFPNSDGLFASNGLSAIVSFTGSATGLNEKEIAGMIQLFPNPARDEVQLIIAKEFPASDIKTEFIDATGSVVKIASIEAVNTMIHIGGLNPGIYVVKITLPGYVIFKKLVVQ